MDQSPAEPYVKFLEQSRGFHAANNYLLSASLTALKNPETELGMYHTRLEDRVRGTYKDPYNYFISRLFISYIADFEIFIQETASKVILKNPKKAGGVEFKLSEIIDSSSQQELIERAAENILNGIMYKKPKAYLSEICSLLSIDESSISPTWNIFIEAKARRDLGVHNGWICNHVFLRKMQEAGIETKFSVGDLVIPQEDRYLGNVLDALETLSREITRAVFDKHWPELSIIFK